MSYQILIADTATELEELVRDAIVNGWRPAGGIAINEFDHDSCNNKSVSSCFAQAMTKEGK